MSATNITDNLVDTLVSTITSDLGDYFDDMGEIGFSMTAPKVVKKGLPNPIKMAWPSIFIRPSRTTQIDKYAYSVEVEINYFSKDMDSEKLARKIARGADALGQLIRDRFSEQKLDYSFEYAAPEGHPEAVASLTVEIIV